MRTAFQSHFKTLTLFQKECSIRNQSANRSPWKACIKCVLPPQNPQGKISLMLGEMAVPEAPSPVRGGNTFNTVKESNTINSLKCAFFVYEDIPLLEQ